MSASIIGMSSFIAWSRGGISLRMASSRSSNLRLPYVIQPTIAPSAAPMAAIMADADPPPGAGEREPSASMNARTLMDASGSSRFSPIMYSMMRLSGSNGVMEERPRRSTASRIFCRSSRMNSLSFSM